MPLGQPFAGSQRPESNRFRWPYYTELLNQLLQIFLCNSGCGRGFHSTFLLGLWQMHDVYPVWYLNKNLCSTSDASQDKQTADDDLDHPTINRISKQRIDSGPNLGMMRDVGFHQGGKARRMLVHGKVWLGGDRPRHETILTWPMISWVARSIPLQPLHCERCMQLGACMLGTSTPSIMRAHPLVPCRWKLPTDGDYSGQNAQQNANNISYVHMSLEMARFGIIRPSRSIKQSSNPHFEQGILVFNDLEL
ncbi:hypothetical protein ACLOJK_013534 [Asimina triloba]